MAVACLSPSGEDCRPPESSLHSQPDVATSCFSKASNLISQSSQLDHTRETHFFNWVGGDLARGESEAIFPCSRRVSNAVVPQSTCCRIIFRPPSRHLESYAVVSFSVLRVLCSSRPPLSASSSLSEVWCLLCLSNTQALCSNPLWMIRVEMTALNALSLTIVTGRWMCPEHHVLPRGEGVSFLVASNAEAGLLQIQYVLPARTARASGDEGVCL